MKRLDAAGSMRFPRFVFIVCICLYLLPLPAVLYAQSIEDALARSGYTAADRGAITDFFARIDRQEVPVELLLPKLEEGVSKRISAPRVLEALEREAQFLRRSRALILGVTEQGALLSDRALWARTANLLAGGIPESEIEGLIHLCLANVEGYRPATYLYVALKDWGLPRQSAFELIDALLKSPIAPESYMGVMNLLAAGRRRRIAPDEIVRRIRRSAAQSLTIEELERWIY